jgi:hypothetical protein
VTAEVTATTPDDNYPRLIATAAHSKVVTSHQVAARTDTEEIRSFPLADAA